MKIVNQLFEKSKSFQLLVVMYKRAKRIYVDHGVKKGAASIIKCCSKSFFSTFGLNIIYYDNNKVNQIIKLLDKMTIHHDGRSSFYYWIDEKLYLVNRHKLTGNMPVDYSFIIDNSLNEIKQKIIASDNSDKRLLDLLAAIERYIDRICIEIKKTKGKNSEIISNLQSMKTRKAKNLQDALQRILFWNSLLHQTGHTLVGLGRLDYILDRFPIDDIKYVKSLLREFCKTL
ncbi:MAG: hypothetical protein IKO36_05535, partial [Bacteroidaceae bacterium]|nr:hypothetical protein [Bacteroidaceae bacterium]